MDHMKAPRLTLLGVIAGLALITLTAHAQTARQPIWIKLLVPAAAEVEFDGYKTSMTGESRSYESTPVASRRTYTYALKVMVQGQTVTRDITVRPGMENTFDLRSAFEGGAQQAAAPAGGRRAGYEPAAETSLSAEEALRIATDAYIYGYPLVTMEMTRRVITNVAEPKGSHGPMGQFANLRQYPTAAFKEVTAPNADTLYSAAWLDLSKEPYVLSLPDVGDRYYLMPMLSGWTNVFEDPGTRTTGTKPQTYAISCPNWKGALPDGVKELKSPTNMVWIIGRTYCTGTPEDYEAVHALQDKYKLVPLSAYGKDYTPPKGKVDPDVDMKTPVRDQVNALKAGDFFKLLAKLMKENPPAKEDADMVAKLKKIGIEPGKDFDISKLDPAVAKGLESATKPALEKIVAHMKDAGKDYNGWVFPIPGGVYGTDYIQRATICYFGLGCNRTKDAVYPTSETTTEGEPYNGANKYTVTFPKGQLPPVNGFWSLTMYNGEYFFVENKLNRYTLSERNKLKENEDGSVTLYLQNESPGTEKESNWLPAPKGKFVLMLRLYWPKEKDPSILDGTWKPPAVKKG
jgi:uncharacterized protein (TIGR03000 family)